MSSARSSEETGERAASPLIAPADETVFPGSETVVPLRDPRSAADGASIAGARERSANIAARLHEFAVSMPEHCAIAQPVARNADGTYRYDELSFSELDRMTDRLAAGLRQMGVRAGARLVLFVPFSSDFLTLTFGILKAGAVVVLIDPGMGRQNVFHCLEEIDPHGFIAIPKVHAVRLFKRRLFRNAILNVTVGRRWFWGGQTLEHLERCEQPFEGITTRADDPAAIIFTSGSTGVPKGVCYEHSMFVAQAEMIRDHYGISPGEVDLPGFPLFGLFNAAMGVTTVIPDMDPTRPADVDPQKICQHIADRRITQAFGSPAFWNRVGRHCEQHHITFPTLKRALSAGGPVPVHVLERMQRVLANPEAQLHTPYGATECLPVSSIGAREVLDETASQTRRGAGTCVGSPFQGVEVRIIPISGKPIARLADTPTLPAGEIGEIIVRSRSATREYYQRPEATALAKIQDQFPPGWWHRMGDVGYLDEAGRIWFCGRKSHIVETAGGQMFPVCCEALINEHPGIYRSALVGVGPRPQQRPVIIVEPEEGAFPTSEEQRQTLIGEVLQLAASDPLTASIQTVLLHRSLPVDPRHNVKLNREQLAVWAESEMQ